jgi:hypothetical protein
MVLNFTRWLAGWLSEYKSGDGKGGGGVKLGTKHRVNYLYKNNNNRKLKMDNCIKNLFNFGP